MTYEMTCHAVKTYKLFFSEYWISLDPYNVRNLHQRDA